MSLPDDWHNVCYNILILKSIRTCAATNPALRCNPCGCYVLCHMITNGGSLTTHSHLTADDQVKSRNLKPVSRGYPGRCQLVRKGMGGGTSEPVAREDLREATPQRKSSHREIYGQHVIYVITIDSHYLSIYIMLSCPASIVWALRVTPAMEAGITKRPWDVEDLLAEA